MRRWGGNRLTLGRVVTRKETGAHYLIESTGLDLDTAGEWLRRVPIVKLQYLKRLEGVAGACNNDFSFSGRCRRMGLGK